MPGIYDEIDSQRRRAKKALLEGRFDDAITQAELSLMDLALIPDGEKEGDAGAKLTWNREAIVAFINLIKEKRADAAVNASAGGMGMTTHPIQNTRPYRGGSHRGDHHDDHSGCCYEGRHHG